MANRAAFSLYQKTLKSGPFWYARFYDPSTGKYSITRSTGIQVKGKSGQRVKAHQAAEAILEELESQEAPYFIDYLISFWRPDSPYVKAKRLAEKKPLSAYYVEANAAGVKKHVKPYKPFQRIQLSDVKPGMIEDWKMWALEKGTGPRRINAMLNAMKVAVRHAVARGDIDHDPFLRIKKVAYSPKEKGILNPVEVEKLISVNDQDPRAKAAVLLAALCGLRRGEARGLRWMDIDRESGLIHVVNNYVDSEGSKGCKAGSERRVLLHSALIPVIDQLATVSPYSGTEDFILFSLDSRSIPCSTGTIKNGLSRILRNIGISRDDQKARNLTFHGLRHTFVTVARMAGIPDIAVQALAGHKTAAMMERYSHAAQVIDFESARAKLEATG